MQVFHRRVTLARALLHTSRFLSVAVSCEVYCGGYSVVCFLPWSGLRCAAASTLILKINHLFALATVTEGSNLYLTT